MTPNTTALHRQGDIGAMSSEEESLIPVANQVSVCAGTVLSSRWAPVTQRSDSQATGGLVTEPPAGGVFGNLTPGAERHRGPGGKDSHLMGKAQHWKVLLFR